MTKMERAPSAFWYLSLCLKETKGFCFFSGVSQQTRFGLLVYFLNLAGIDCQNGLITVIVHISMETLEPGFDLFLFHRTDGSNCCGMR